MWLSYTDAPSRQPRYPVESQVKERIVGAAVLVALGVWLIPWVLDGTSEAPAEPEVAEQLILPAADESEAPFRTETVELDPVATVPEIVADTTADEADSNTETREPVASEATGEPQAASGETFADAGEAVASPSIAVREPEAPAGGWSVQVGAFSELANASQIVSRVETFGFDAFVSEVESGGQTLHRVRVAGFDGENQAEAAASSLSAHGFRPRVIPPEE
jgi:DedD protein